MVDIRKVREGRIVGQGKLPKPTMQKIFDFCKIFDISNVTDPNPLYIFDVRGGVIHWLDNRSREIVSSLYIDETKGSIRIEVGDAADWSEDFALSRWKEVIEKAVSGGY